MDLKANTKPRAELRRPGSPAALADSTAALRSAARDGTGTGSRPEGRVTANCGPRRIHAFTLIELMVVIAIVLIVAALLLPTLSRAGAKGKQVACLSHLRQIGAGFHVFANDHGDRFPMQVSIHEGGSLEYNRSAPTVADLFAFSFRNFQVLSNELGTPLILLCPAERRSAASTFLSLTDRQVSYFAGLQAAPSNPNSILSGDGNLAQAAPRPNANGTLGDLSLGWNRALHDERGHLLFAEGRVELLRSFALRRHSGGPMPARTSSGGVSATPTTRATRSAAARDEAPDRPSVNASAPLESGATHPPGLAREPKPNPGAATSSTNLTTGGGGFLGSAGAEVREEWDTDRFRFFASLFKLGLLAYALAGAVLLAAYYLRKRKEGEKSPS